MGTRFELDRMEKAHVPCYRLWHRAGEGRFWKRQLSKARRRAWKQKGIEGRENNCYESECHYKGW